MLTGRYGVRNGVTWNNSTAMKPSEVTIAQVLKNQGYATANIGSAGRIYISRLPLDKLKNTSTATTQPSSKT